jgi:perosamine synthetase
VKIPVAEPLLIGREHEYVTEALKSGWISSQGKYITEFEEKFSRYCGARYGIATSSGTTALHLALAALNIGKGDEVIIPTFTMIATANAVTYTGAKPVLVDSETETWNLNTEKIEEKITPKTKAIIAVHTYGHPVDMAPVLDLAETYGLYVIEDAAEAHGAEYKGMKIGGLGDVGCFSFYANKIITTGEGGMVITSNEEIAEKARILRAHAFSEDRHFWHRYLGFNYRMSNLQAAIGVAQLENIDNLVEIRRRNAKIYNALMENINGITLPPEARWAKNVYWMYSILVEDNFGMNRDELMKELRKDGIESRTFFYPIHVQPIYSQLYKNEKFPVADELSRKGINLPSGSTLTEEDIEYIVSSIKRAHRGK